jgi:2-oxoisovalerate dehydrogenase E1 component
MDAPVKIIGSLNTPAIPLNSTLEFAMLPNVSMVEEAIEEMLNY